MLFIPVKVKRDFAYKGCFFNLIFFHNYLIFCDWDTFFRASILFWDLEIILEIFNFLFISETFSFSLAICVPVPASVYVLGKLSLTA